MIFTLIEIAIIILFALFYIFFKTKRKMLIYSLIFSAIFELLGVLSNGYTYNFNFSFSIFNVPLFIILSWSIIIVTSYTLVSKITNHRLTKAFICALSVISVDLVFEASSVALGLWKWNTFSNTLYANINPFNFIGWLLVSFLFIYFYEKKPIYSIILGIPVYMLIGVFYFGLSMISIIKNTNPYLTLVIIYLIFIIFSITLYVKHRIHERNKLNLKELVEIWLFRLPFFLFGIIACIIVGDYSYPFVLLIMFIGLVQEMIIYVLIIEDKKITRILKRKGKRRN